MAPSPAVKVEHKSSNKKRLSTGKSRTGCRRCKIRRIKCDESKPSCTRCLNSGWSCDGYGIMVKRDVTRETSLSGPDIHTYRSERENRGFDYFRHKALSELIGFDTKSEFWGHVVLQFSEASPAVFRAVLSLSSLHEASYSQPAIKPYVENRVSFLRQYNKAIRQLCSRRTEQPIQFTLTCCILFVCLENLRGDHEAALLHLGNGLKILKQWHTEEVAASDYESREIITRAFHRLDMQATTFLDSRQPQLDSSPMSKASPKATKKLLSFDNLEQARETLETLSTKLFYIITTKSNSEHPSWSMRNEYLPVRKSLLQGINIEFRDWKSAFDTLSLQQNQQWQKDELRLSMLLALHHHTTSLMIDIRLSTNSEGRYCGVSKDADWLKLTDFCQSMISSFASSKPSFAADTGLIAPLYFTAMEAGNSQIRQRAIKILYQIKWKEGFWNAGTAARVAETVLHNQISGTTDTNSTGSIRDLAKIHGINPITSC